MWVLKVDSMVGFYVELIINNIHNQPPFNVFPMSIANDNTTSGFNDNSTCYKKKHVPYQHVFNVGVQR